MVKEKNCNLGFAHDPDADRIIVIDEYGVAISEEYTLALGVEAILSKNPNNKVVEFEVIIGKAKGEGIELQNGDIFKPDEYNTISRGVGTCPRITS